MLESSRINIADDPKGIMILRIYCVNIKRSVGYVEFYEESSVDKAILLTGQKLLGIPVIVQRSEAEKNRIAEQNAA